MTLDQLLASGRNYVSYGAGFATAIGVLSATQSADIQTDVNHVLNGIKEISIGLGPLIVIGTSWWASHRSSPAAQVATVSALPTTKGFVTTDPVLAAAAKTADPQTEVKLAPPLAITPKGAAA